MTDYERLLDEVSSDGVEVIEKYHFDSERIRGLYCDGTIALSAAIATDRERMCVLAEEWGHYKTAYGDIVLQDSPAARKQELRGRIFAYNKCVGLTGIISAYKMGCRNRAEIAEHLGVSEPFLIEALEYLQRKHGTHVELDNYVIYFEPLSVLALL